MEDTKLTGLSAGEVEERKEKGLTNKTEISTEKTVKEIIISNTFTYFNFIFLVITILLCIVGSFRNLTFLPIIIGNTLVGIVQEIRAKAVLDKMSLLNAPHAVVVRDGGRKKVASEELVKDDVVLFTAGNQICADARVLRGSVQVNEALLTGEQDEISKKPGDALLSGSFIVSGECYAVLEKVGAESYISKLAAEAKSLDGSEQSEMIRSINKIVKWMGIIVIPIGVILFYQGYYVNHVSFRESIVSMVAAIIGMIPEGLYLLTTVALALGTIRLAQKQVLLHDMKSIETLARVDVLCVDKTGTITEPGMQLNRMEALAEAQALAGGENPSLFLEEKLKEYVATSTDNNSTMEALKEYYFDGAKLIQPKKQPVSIFPFSSAVKYGAITFEDGTWILGAPEFVLKEGIMAVQERIKPYTEKGYRVLVFAYQKEPLAEGGALAGELTPVGIVVLTNAIRENAKKTFQYFKEQDVAIKVISGDNPKTVSEVARMAGIENADQYIDATLLDTEEKVAEAVKQYTVFGRVTPKQKQMLVKALQNQGHTVAMTGDGVNDILAMKDADCSIAMASGSEAATQAAQVVLLDSDFEHMPNVVLEGRRVVNNVQRSASLFLVKNIFSLLLAVFSSILFLTYPLEPSQISLISMFTIGIPGFLLALETNKNRIEGHFLKNVMLKALPAGLTDVLIVGSLTVCGKVFGIAENDIATAATMLLAVVGFMILEKISHPFNKFKVAVYAVNIAGIILCGIFLPDLFALTGMSGTSILLMIVFAFAAESLFRNLSILIESGNKAHSRRQEAGKKPHKLKKHKERSKRV